jgi:hypothetical protein
LSNFTTDVFQNEFLPVGGTEVNAVVTVSCTGGAAGSAAAAASVDGAEVIIVDTSGSMDVPKTKIRAAREGCAVAVDCIRDGVKFAVIAGTQSAHMIFPTTQSLAVSSPATRAAAKEAVAGLRASGGTAMGRWLAAAKLLFGAEPAAACHAILLTDGENAHETDEEFAAAIRSCEGVFQCDCRGVGTDWHVAELRQISSALLGSVDIIPDAAGLAADFQALMEAAMGKETAAISLRLWTPQGATVKFVRQVAPTVEELTGRGVASGPLSHDYPTGTWGEESRDYHVCVEVAARSVGEEMLAGRVMLMEGSDVIGQGLVKATWTDDEALSTRINREVAHYTGQAELAGAIQDGLEARKAGDEGTARLKLGRAVQLASESGNEGTMRLLRGVVDIEDEASGTVRLRAKVDDADEMALDTRSTKTVRVGGGGGAGS